VEDWRRVGKKGETMTRGYDYEETETHDRSDTLEHHEFDLGV
jgi:hypothetical protein